MKKILIGTHNKGKFREIAYLLSKKYKKVSPVSLKIPSPKETSKSFSGNSKLKVNFFSKFVDFPVISDDSGLCISSLKNKPGIYSARLASRHGSFSKAMIFILKKMKHKKNRSAVFICSLSFKHPKKKLINVTGKIKGSIARSIRGKKGFGYDPIFIPNKYEKTFGQFSKIEKMKMDHRYEAFKKLKRKIKTL